MKTLKRPYITVKTKDGTSYGGNQAWFAYRFLRKRGCGVISAADGLLYLKGYQTLPQKEYTAFATELWKFYLPVIPGFGMNGLTLMAGLNGYFIKNKLPYRACWGISSKKLIRRVDEMLSKDLPVILAIGPNFPKFWGKKTVTLYRKDAQGQYAPAAKTKAHFVTVTGREGQKLRISSWGKEYWINLLEYEEYVRSFSSPLVSNIVYVKNKGV